MYYCTPGTAPGCESPECCCDCHARSLDDIARAVALDDRPDETLASIARDMEAERRPDVDVLQRERFGINGWPTRGRA